jgi:subtilisin family serine protease
VRTSRFARGATVLVLGVSLLLAPAAVSAKVDPGNNRPAPPAKPTAPEKPSAPGKPSAPDGPSSTNSGNNSQKSEEAQQPGNPGRPDDTGKPSNPGRPDTEKDTQAPGFSKVIIRFAPGVSARAGSQAVTSAKGEVDHTYRNVFSGVAATVPESAIRALRKNPAIAAVEFDAEVSVVESAANILTFAGTQSQPVWGLDRIDQTTLPLDSKFAYDDLAGTGVRTYVIDTGVRADHREFAGRVLPGYSAINDGRGTSDCNGHGTHVAGTISGTTYGVAKLSEVVPVRVLDCNGSGTWSGVIAGLDWIAASNPPGQAAVANMSLGGSANSSVDAAVRSLITRGVSVVVAAGNSNADACLSSPARVREAVTVAATDITDSRASFSNHGTCVDIFAPGVGIVSATATTASSTASYSGTSMASPHAAGAAALILARLPGASPVQISTMLSDTSTTGVISNPLGSPNRLLRVQPFDDSASEPADELTVPDAPGSVTAVKINRKVIRVSWSKPADGGSPLTDYLVTAYSLGSVAGTWRIEAGSTQVDLNRLRNRTTYTFTVRASNALGTSPESQASGPVRTG